ncbi:MAG: response regulator transcription factor [Endomicrobia bacterium]|nr:response regulator transcription factor [Endomicrobiia bacterium]MCX7940947.1 response regulator transcription factor [Endomicrobiia bacterium]MDW8055652.1 response regulator transcription factor [Elusimicrobiota bacterium]
MNKVESLAEPQEKTILIVEDDDTVLTFFEYYLTKQGFNVITAKDGQQALEKIAQSIPDLIILDALLPKKSGYEVVKTLQQSHKKIPIIVVSGQLKDLSMQMMFKMEPNVKDFLTKPVQPDLLLSKIHSLLGTKSKEAKIAEQRFEEYKKKFEE